MGLNRFHIVSPIALMAFSACRSPSVQGGSVGGAVVNGPLNSALVFLDYNFDGILDAGEPNARTNQFGEYQLTTTRDNYDLVAIADAQTVDTSSGATFSGITLKAPSGAGIISPTSTLMQEGNLTAAEVAEVLGLPDGVDPLTFNPFNVDETDAAAVAKALEVAKISKQITTAISSFASATEGAGADAADAFNTALNSVVDVVKTKAAKAKDGNASAAEKTLDFTATNDLDLIKTQVTTKATNLTGLDTTTLNALADDTSSAIKNVNDKIATVTDLKDPATKDIFSTTQVLRDQIKDVAVARKAGEAGDITFKNLSAVETAMSNKAPEAITLSGDRLISPDKGSLIVGKLATVDGDQGAGAAFTYTLDGKDADMFSFNAATGELSLKEKPDYAQKPFYDVTVITKDAGGKKFAETFKIDVVPEFTGLAAPDSKAAADFTQIIKENPLFKDMVNHMELKQTPDGKLVLEEKGQGLSADAPKPIMAVVKLTDRGYELRNPANDEYMSGFFKYETGGLTYTGYEVFIPNRNMLGENQKDLFKYFSAKNEYGSNKLPFTDRDVDFVSIAGAKITDKDGNVVSDMYGFSHYDKTMTVLGSTGIDIANASNPLYIEVSGEFVPGVTSNITTTALTKANADAMKAVIEKAGGAVLYGEKTTTFGTDTSAPTLSNVSIASNNTDATKAEAGDNVTLTFTASEAIGTPVVTFKSGGAAINDSSVTYTNISGNTWTAVYTADASDTVGAVSFSIAFSDTASNAATPVTIGTGSVTTDSKIDTQKLLESISVFTEMGNAIAFNSTNSGLTLEDKSDSGIYNVTPVSAPPGIQDFAIISTASTPNKTATITTKTDGNSLTRSSTETEAVSPIVLFGGNKLIDVFFLHGLPKVRYQEVSLKESYSSGDSRMPDHHWLTMQFFDPSGGIEATAGISLGSQSFKFAELGHVYMQSQGSTQFALESKVNLSTSEANLAKGAFFDLFEDIVLENTAPLFGGGSPGGGLIRMPVELELIAEAYVIEEPTELDLKLLEPLIETSEII